MGYRTPNIDRIAKEGVSFTDYYGQQGCTAGRAAFINGSVPARTGMTKVGMPAAKEGWQMTDITMATVIKSLGYATGQFGKNHIDGCNLLDYLAGESKESPRREFIYMNDGGEVAAIRVGDWKAMYLENRADRLQIWKEPFVALRTPDLYNLRRDPFEESKIDSNTYEDWYIDRAYLLGPMQIVAGKFLMTLKEFPPSQSPGDWSLKSLEERIKHMNRGGN